MEILFWLGSFIVLSFIMFIICVIIIQISNIKQTKEEMSNIAATMYFLSFGIICFLAGAAHIFHWIK